MSLSKAPIVETESMDDIHIPQCCQMQPPAMKIKGVITRRRTESLPESLLWGRLCFDRFLLTWASWLCLLNLHSCFSTSLPRLGDGRDKSVCLDLSKRFELSVVCLLNLSLQLKSIADVGRQRLPTDRAGKKASFVYWPLELDLQHLLEECDMVMLLANPAKWTPDAITSWTDLLRLHANQPLSAYIKPKPHE